MRTLQGWLLPVFMLPMAVYAQEATVKEVHDAPAVRGSIIANMLQEHDNPFTLYPVIPFIFSARSYKFLN